MPEFTIIVPAYNAEATLGETLEAILVQTFDDWECVVVDDGSTDSTRALADGFASRDARLRVLTQENRGTAGAYNTGVGAATGDYIVLCSADDYLLPEHLEHMAVLIDSEPEHQVYSSNGYMLRPDGERQLRYDGPEWQRRRCLSFAEITEACFFGVGSATLRTEILARGGFREGIYAEDYDLWLRAMAGGVTHCYTPVATAVHRVSESQKSAARELLMESYVRIFQDLSRDFRLDERDAEAVKQALSRSRGQLADAVAARILEQDSSGFRNLVQRVFGVNFGERVLGWAHRVTWMVRPLRSALARRRARHQR